MPRNVTVHFSDGSRTVFNNVPDNVTSAQVAQRASSPGKNITIIDGGSAQAPRPAAPVQTSVGGAIWRGIQDALPGHSYLEAGTNYIGSHLGLNSTPNSMSYVDRVRAIQARDQANEDADRAQHPIAHYGSEVAGAVGSAIAGGALVKGGAAALAASQAPRIVQAGNVLQKLATLKKGQTMANAGKLAVQGGAQGAVYGAGASDPSQIGTGAAEGLVTGAIAAPALAGLVKAPGFIGRNLARPLSTSLPKAAQEVITEDPAAIAARMKALSDQTGAPVPVAAALSPQDFANVTQKVIKNHPDALAAAQGQTGKYISGFMDRMLGHVNAAGKLAANQPDGALSTTIGDLSDMQQQTANDLMDPIRHTQIDLADLNLPQDHADLVKRYGGNIVSSDIPGQPGLGDRLRMALAPKADPESEKLLQIFGIKPPPEPIPATLGEMDQLRRTLSSGAKALGNSNPADSGALRNAGQTVSDYVKANLPAGVADAYQHMLGTYQTHAQVMNGFETAAQGQVPSDIADPILRADLNTPAGKTGLAAGELYRQRAAVTKSPVSAINTAQNFAAQGALTRPSSIEPGAALPGTVTANLGDAASAGLSTAAQGESAVLGRMLDTNKLNQAAATEQGTLSPTDIAHAALLHGSSPMFQARLVARLMSRVTGLNPTVATNLATKLYSSNPADVTEAMQALQRGGLGQDAVKAIMGDTSPAQAVGAAAANQGAQAMAPTAPPVAPSAPVTIPDAQDANGITGTVTDDGTGHAPDPAAPGGLPVNPQGYSYPADANPTAGPVDPTKSPYMPLLQHIYDTEKLPFLKMVEQQQYKESRGNQFDKHGNPLTSPKGAVGIMQLEPDTAKEVAASIGVPYNPSALANDPAYNKLLGLSYAGSLVHRYGGDYQKAAAAYNAGPGAVDAAIAKDPENWLLHTPAETQDYAGDIG